MGYRGTMRLDGGFTVLAYRQGFRRLGSTHWNARIVVGFNESWQPREWAIRDDLLVLGRSEYSITKDFD